MAANGHGGSPCRLCQRVVALVAGGIAIALTQERSKTMGIVSMYIAEISLELTLGPISTHTNCNRGRVASRVEHSHASPFGVKVDGERL